MPKEAGKPKVCLSCFNYYYHHLQLSYTSPNARCRRGLIQCTYLRTDHAYIRHIYQHSSHFPSHFSILTTSTSILTLLLPHSAKPSRKPRKPRAGRRKPRKIRMHPNGLSPPTCSSLRTGGRGSRPRIQMLGLVSRSLFVSVSVPDVLGT
jgi:hypothetical protein